MKYELKLIGAAGLLAVSATTSQALPYNARGEFNGWGETALTDNLDGTHGVTISSLTPSAAYKFKIAENGWASSWPAGDAKCFSDTNGDLTLKFRPGVTFDGWNPQAPRVGYVNPGLFGWEIIGAFNDWNDTIDVATRQMTNQGNGLHTVNYMIAKPPGTYEFKFRKSGDWGTQYNANQFDYSGSGGNLQVTTTVSNQPVLFQLDMPNGRWLAGAPLAAATNKVTFLVDMQVPISEYPATSGFDTNSDALYVRGSFNGWATQPAYQLLPVVPGGTLYSNTVDIVAYSGTTIYYKFFGDAYPGEETPLLSCNSGRSVTINSTAVNAPLAYWSDRRLSDPTNAISLQVDMSVQIATGMFNPGAGDQVYVRGTFNNWGDSPGVPLAMTNLPAPSTNIYVGVANLPNWPIGACLQYKFYNNHAGAPNSGWESVDNHQLNIASPTQVVPAAFYNNVEICDVLEQTTPVTFTVDMTGVTTITPRTGVPYPFTNGVSEVFINGDFANWWGWKDDNSGNIPPAAFALTNIPSTSKYTGTVNLPAGNSLRLVYKYSVDGWDAEASFGNDHARYVRNLPGEYTYAVPDDKWTGTDPVNIANLQEPKFGNLRVVPGSPGQVQIQWLGLKCIQMQGSTNLTTTNWTTYPATDGTSSTNWPATGSQNYFRLLNTSP